MHIVEKKKKKQIVEFKRKTRIMEQKVVLLERPSVQNEIKIKDGFADITIKEFKNFPADLSEAIVVLGFPSHTLVGVLTAGFLQEKLNLPLIGCFTSRKFPPRAVIENGTVFL